MHIQILLTVSSVCICNMVRCSIFSMSQAVAWSVKSIQSGQYGTDPLVLSGHGNTIRRYITRVEITPDMPAQGEGIVPVRQGCKIIFVCLLCF